MTPLEQEWKEFLDGCLDNVKIARELNVQFSRKESPNLVAWEMPNRILVEKVALKVPGAKEKVMFALMNDRAKFIEMQVVQLKRDWTPFKVLIKTHDTKRGLVVYWQSLEAFEPKRN